MLQEVAKSLRVALLITSSIPLWAQIQPPVRFCSAGITPDAYIDWTKMPAPPAASAQGTPVPANATIPVAGAPGLSVSVNINSTGAIQPSQPTYAVKSAVDLFVNSANTTITLTFSQPIRGFSVSVPTRGRFERKFTLSGYSGGPHSGAPADSQVSSSALDFPSPGDKSETPLQIRAETANIRQIVFEATTANVEYFSLDLINARIETAMAADPATQIPKNGLIQWLRADQVYDPYAPYGDDRVTLWPDASGSHADATANANTAPTGRQTGNYCAPAVVFDGSSSMTAHVPINGLSGLTVFLASTADDDAAGWWEKQALIFDEDAAWGSTFVTPSQTHVFFRIGTTQVNNQPGYKRSSNIAGDFTVTSVMHRDSTDSLEVNGVPVFQATKRLSTITGATATEHLGAGLLGTHFFGSIGEVLVYNRALTANERAVVTNYLMKKFGTL